MRSEISPETDHFDNDSEGDLEDELGSSRSNGLWTGYNTLLDYLVGAVVVVTAVIVNLLLILFCAAPVVFLIYVASKAIAHWISGLFEFAETPIVLILGIAIALTHFAARIFLTRPFSEPVETDGEEILRGSSIEAEYQDEPIELDIGSDTDADGRFFIRTLFPNRRWATSFEIKNKLKIVVTFLEAFAKGWNGK